MTAIPVDVSSLLREVGAAESVEGEADLGPFTIGGESFDPTGPVRYAVTFTNTGRGVLAHGSAIVTVRAECARCLSGFELTLDGEPETLFVEPGNAVETGADETETGVVEGGRIDLGPAVRAALVLRAPFAPHCSDDCRGMCSRCGEPLPDEGSCSCVPEARESPFAALEGFFDEDDSSE